MQVEETPLNMAGRILCSRQRHRRFDSADWAMSLPSNTVVATEPEPELNPVDFKAECMEEDAGTTSNDDTDEEDYVHVIAPSSRVKNKGLILLKGGPKRFESWNCSAVYDNESAAKLIFYRNLRKGKHFDSADYELEQITHVL